MWGHPDQTEGPLSFAEKRGIRSWQPLALTARLPAGDEDRREPGRRPRSSRRRRHHPVDPVLHRDRRRRGHRTHAELRARGQASALAALTARPRPLGPAQAVGGDVAQRVRHRWPRFSASGSRAASTYRSTRASPMARSTASWPSSRAAVVRDQSRPSRSLRPADGARSHAARRPGRSAPSTCPSCSPATRPRHLVDPTGPVAAGPPGRRRVISHDGTSPPSRSRRAPPAGPSRYRCVHDGRARTHRRRARDPLRGSRRAALTDTVDPPPASWFRSGGRRCPT